jgi:hypothetical protein
MFLLTLAQASTLISITPNVSFWQEAWRDSLYNIQLPSYYFMVSSSLRNRGGEILWWGELCQWPLISVRALETEWQGSYLSAGKHMQMNVIYWYSIRQDTYHCTSRLIAISRMYVRRVLLVVYWSYYIAILQSVATINFLSLVRSYHEK